MSKIKILSVKIFLSVLISNGVFAMGLSDAGKVCLFSKMTGVIKLDGKPVSNARLVRTVNLSKDEVDETTKDEKGNFKLDAKFTRTITKFLPQEFVVSQYIIVHYEDKEYEMWNGVKRKPEENTESRGKPLVVECELSDELNVKKVNGSPIVSLCTWDAEADPKPNIEEMMKLVK
ncbi:carboxypeptidase regulatory-like domain-containing protein [bacterium]|nr:carboxypeptidase regulatory-like domain-containing protein [bacterium]